MSRVTIKDIAKQAGVSTTTVSFAFNYPERLPAETVASILAIAKGLHYVPNPIARSMLSGRSGTIGVILPSPIHGYMLNPFLADYLQGVSEVCDAEELSFTILPPTRKKFEQSINRSMVDGFVTILGIDKDSQEMEFLKQRGIPIVMVDCEPIEGLSTIKIDDEIGAYEGMKYILACGHRNIAIISGRTESSQPSQNYSDLFQTRMLGYKKALSEFGMGFESPAIRFFDCGDTIAGGAQTFPRVWESKNPPTAIVTTSDLIAFGVILAAQNIGVRVPQDLSIMGYDDLQLSAGFIPPLTTIHQPNYEKGKMATELLIKNIANSEVQHIILPTELRIRNSVKRINS